MRRVVLDPGVFVSALITPSGSPGLLLREIRSGQIELFVSPRLLEELDGVLRRNKFRRYVSLATARKYVHRIRDDAIVAPDPEGPPPLRSADPKDDYLIALAHSQNATLVSGDKHLLDLCGGGAPILSPVDLLVAVA
jgi:putative PIN family toxin of toxin-antitoxin system